MADIILGTGELADLLTRLGDEPVDSFKLQHALRKRRLPPPPLRAGRRFWTLEYVLAAGDHFGISADAIMRELSGSETGGAA